MTRDHLPDETPEERRARSLARMTEVYGWEMSDGAGDFFAYTADHLFGDIWSRPGLDDTQRRLVLIGMLLGQQRHDVLGIQLEAALTQGNLSPAELREIVILACHYAGWPVGATMNSQVETLIGKHAPDEALG